MAQEGYDALIGLTDSRYRLSTIVALRAAQLKSGIPSVLEVGQLPSTENSVTVAMKELEITEEVKWSTGDDLPTMAELRRVAVPEPTPDVVAAHAVVPASDDN